MQELSARFKARRRAADAHAPGRFTVEVVAERLGVSVSMLYAFERPGSISDPRGGVTTALLNHPAVLKSIDFDPDDVVLMVLWASFPGVKRAGRKRVAAVAEESWHRS